MFFLNTSCYLTIGFAAILFLSLLFTTIQFYNEHEPKAAFKALILTLVVSSVYFICGFYSFYFQAKFAMIVLIGTIFIGFLFLIPFGGKTIQNCDKPKCRIDERDTMFSRRLLESGSSRFDEYYAKNQEKKALDDTFRKRPGLLNKKSSFYDPVLFASADAAFGLCESLRPYITGEVSKDKIRVHTKKMTHFIKKWIKKNGAHSVGVTKLKDYHLYSTGGRLENYGEPIESDHQFAIAFTVEMDIEMMKHAPFAPVVMESSNQYLDSAVIAIMIADFIRRLGYDARAHIDGAYQVVCPLVGRDAGLGEIGRMGLLMTPKLGPRVRIAVISTSMPLEIDKRTVDASVSDFCEKCKKCADVCPSKSIPFGKKKEIDGVKRWKINSDDCFLYWSTVGTDCGRCMTVCPYSHPNNFFHNVVRFGIKHSYLFRIFALKMDDFFYTRKLVSKRLTPWLKVTNQHK